LSHPEQLAFFRLVVEANDDLLRGGRVLEIGSYDVNGSMRDLFRNASDYVGVDLKDGPGVDRVAYGHEVEEPDGSFDAVVSGECFEHDPHYIATFTNMIRLTRPGGLVAFTCASHGRPEHGTRRTLVSDSPGTQAEGLDYYENLRAQDFAQCLDGFSAYRFWYMPTTFDLYFAGVRAGGAEAVLPVDRDVQAIRRLMSFPRRMVRWPLRVALVFTDGGPRYQRLILPYWLRMVRTFG
jgi:SAM-dependent methyltransferase